MRLIILLCALLSTFTAKADVVELQDVYINWTRLGSGSRNYLLSSGELQGKEPDQRLTLGFNVDLLKNVYWNNEIISYTMRHEDTKTPEQFRSVAWKFEVGLRVFTFMSVEYRHISQHLLDVEGNQRYPVEDSVGLQFNVYSKHEKGALIDF